MMVSFYTTKVWRVMESLWHVGLMTKDKMDMESEEYWEEVIEDHEFLDYLDSKKEEKKKLP